jgi:PIN domain nuclease of toxin-antitoxin system
MKVLLDTGVWWRWMTKGPLRRTLLEFLDKEASEFYLCPLSVLEAFYKVERQRLSEPQDKDWRTRIVEGFKLAPVTFESARLAAEWTWAHGDPVDRILAAVAATQNLTLVHTDRVLKDFAGFPQRYFKSMLPEPTSHPGA